MHRKAQGLSMNVIIIAAIAILVLIILVVLILNQLRKVPEATGCRGVGGICADDCADLEGTYAVDQGNSGTGGGCGADQVCCVRVSGT